MLTISSASSFWRRSAFILMGAYFLSSLPALSAGVSMSPEIRAKFSKLGWSLREDSGADLSLRLMHRRSRAEIENREDLRWESIKVYRKKVEGLPATAPEKLDSAAWASDLKILRGATLARFGFKAWDVEQNRLHTQIAGLKDHNAIELVGSYRDPDGAESAFVEWHVLGPGTYRQLIWSTPGAYYFDSKLPAVRILFESLLQDWVKTGESS